MSRFFLKSLRAANIAVIFFTFAAYLAPYISPQTTWVFAVFGLFYPVLLFLNLLFFLFWLWRKKTYCLFSLGCIILGWTHLTGLMGFNFSQVKPAEPLTVLTYNTRRFTNLFPLRGDNSEEQTAFAERLREKIGTTEIFCLQEFHAYDVTVEKIKKLLNLPHFAKYDGRGTAIFSKYPIIKKGRVEFADTYNSAYWADIKIEEKTVRIYSVHLESVKISGDAAQLRKEGDLRTRETWSGIKSILRKYSHTTNARVNQTTVLNRHVADCPHPVIVCGDFNDTPVSYVYRQTANRLNDNFQTAGSGWGATYAGSIPMLRIDYIFTSPKSFTVYEHGILREKYSDHYPVYSQLRLK